MSDVTLQILSGVIETASTPLIQNVFLQLTYKETIENVVVDGIIPDKLVKPKEILIKETIDAIPELIERLKNKIEGEVLEG